MLRKPLSCFNDGEGKAKQNSPGSCNLLHEKRQQRRCEAVVFTRCTITLAISIGKAATCAALLWFRRNAGHVDQTYTSRRLMAFSRAEVKRRLQGQTKMISGGGGSLGHGFTSC
jgi:FlaA1/EpsC-like NDP-sugar epimerase